MTRTVRAATGIQNRRPHFGAHFEAIGAPDVEARLAPVALQRKALCLLLFIMALCLLLPVGAWLCAWGCGVGCVGCVARVVCW